MRIGSRALDLLIALTDRPGEVVSRHELLDLVWQRVAVDEAAVRVHIASLRRTLGDGQDGNRFIVNIAGRGYSFVAPVVQVDAVASTHAAALPTPRLTVSAPSPPRPRIGRDALVRSLSELLLTCRFISIVGAGGIGKTTVALAIAEQMRGAFPDEDIVFIDLSAVHEPGLVPGAAIAAIGCTLGGADPASELVNFLAEKRMLLVFDSCEHLVDAISHLAVDLFRFASRIHLLITSRESLRVEGEMVHLLGPLDCPINNNPTATEAMVTPAVQLFMERAASSGFDEVLTDSDAPVVAEICRQTDGIALAIELVASRVGTYGIHGVADLLSSSAELRLLGRRNVTPRHRTLEAMLDWSYNLLTEAERRILAQLSVFVGLFTMDAACAVVGETGSEGPDVAPTVASLVEKSLLWVTMADDRVFYRLLDMTRVYAAAKLAQDSDAAMIPQRHAHYFAALFKGMALQHGAYADIGRHAPHIGNVRKALEWSFAEEEHHVIGIDLAADAAPLFLGLWLVNECRKWSQLALSRITAGGDFSQREMRLLEALAISSLHTRGNTEEVRQAIERGLDLSASEGTGQAQMRLLSGLNLFLTRLGNFDGALVAAKRCAVFAERSGSPGDRIVTEWLLAAAYHMAGDQAAAVQPCERGFALEGSTGRLEINMFGYDLRLRAEIGLARSFWLRGSANTACRLALQAMDHGARLPPPGNYSMSAAHSIPILLWSGNIADAALHIDRVLAHTDRHVLKTHAASAWALKGEWLLMAGHPLDATEMLRHAIAMLRREQHHMVIPAASRALAEALALSGRQDEAQATINATMSDAMGLGQKFRLPELLRTEGEIHLYGPHPNPGAAETALNESIAHAGEQAAIGWQLKAALLLARLLRAQRRHAEAREILGSIYEKQAEKSGSTDLVEGAALLLALQG